MRYRITLALVLMFITCIPSHLQGQGQTQAPGQAKKKPPPPPPPDETPGQLATITAAVPTGGFSCGRVTYPLYCYGIPANIGGTFWLDVSYNDIPSPTGFVSFNNVADLGQATITVATFTTDGNTGQINSMHIVFNGNTVSPDIGTYTGTGAFTFSYYYSSGGGGKGGGYPGYIQVMQSGTLTITYQ